MNDFQKTLFAILGMLYNRLGGFPQHFKIHQKSHDGFVDVPQFKLVKSNPPNFLYRTSFGLLRIEISEAIDANQIGFQPFIISPKVDYWTDDSIAK